MSLEAHLTYIVMPIISLALLFIFIRFLKGPTIADRVISLDLIITIGVGVIGVYSILSKTSSLLDVAMVMALIAFLSTVAFSYYLQKREKND